MRPLACDNKSMPLMERRSAGNFWKSLTDTTGWPIASRALAEKKSGRWEGPGRVSRTPDGRSRVSVKLGGYPGGVVNDAVAVYFLDATSANAFVARWSAG